MTKLPPEYFRARNEGRDDDARRIMDEHFTESGDYCVVAFEICEALDEGRQDDARQIAIKKLRAGYHSPLFGKIVANLLEAKKRAGVAGAKRKKLPPHWVEIGRDFQQLRKANVTYEAACTKLAKKYKRSESTIRTTAAFFNKASSNMGFLAQLFSAD